MDIDGRPMIEWTRGRLSQFKKAYAEADANHTEQFTFMGHVFLTAYAKYLIEYLDGLFNRGDD